MPESDRTSRTDVLLLLSLDRTKLANERTFLAYVRTALAFLIAGVSAIHFLSNAAAVAVGLALIVLSVATLVAGVRSYWRMRGRARTAQQHLHPEAPDGAATR